jgi:transposase
MDIADRFGVSYKAIVGSLRRNGIDVRSTKESHHRKAPRELREEEELRRLYHDEGLTNREIADELGVSETTVTEWRRRHGIEAREPPTGEDHWNWNGGSESIYYGSNWQEKRDEAYERDNGTCQVCSEAGDGDRRLDVHHIRPVRMYDTPEKANVLDNLITLCRQCHRKWEGIPLRPEVVGDE